MKYYYSTCAILVIAASLHTTKTVTMYKEQLRIWLNKNIEIIEKGNEQLKLENQILRLKIQKQNKEIQKQEIQKLKIKKQKRLKQQLLQELQLQHEKNQSATENV